jgi:hypothetical protein
MVKLLCIDLVCLGNGSDCTAEPNVIQHIQYKTVAYVREEPSPVKIIPDENVNEKSKCCDDICQYHEPEKTVFFLPQSHNTGNQ